MSVLDLLRPNIRKLEPYRCARDDYKAGTLLDANENTIGPTLELSAEEQKLELNRYPDPHQLKLKELVCNWRNKQAGKAGFDPGLTPMNLYLGVGSDECLDTLIRAVCVPGKDKLLDCPPTYSMYGVSGDINDVSVVSVPLDLSTFDLQADAVLKQLHADPSIKLAFFCSPGNPTGKRLKEADIEKILTSWNSGLVVVDEAYIDFSGPSLSSWVNKYEHLVVLQTLSKSFGLAGLRCGLCFASPPMARAFNAMKAPYNLSSTTSKIATRALQPESIRKMEDFVSMVCTERERLVKLLSQVPGISKIVGGQDANFIMAQLTDKAGQPSNIVAHKVYQDMAENRGVVVRFRGKEPGCTGCVRISVGNPRENSLVLDQLEKSIAQATR